MATTKGDALETFTKPILYTKSSKHKLKLSNFFSKLKWPIIVLIFSGLALCIFSKSILSSAKKTATVKLVSTADVPESTATPVVSPKPVPEVVEKKVTILQTETGWLNLRRQPTTASTILGTVNAGTSLVELARRENEQKEEWVKVRTKEGIEGWVLGKYTKISPEE